MTAITIATWANKGGVGKTTSAINLAACLCTMNKKCLVIDMDSQGCMSDFLWSDGETEYYNEHGNVGSLEDILQRHLDPKQFTVITSFRYYDRETKSYPELMLDAIYCTQKLATVEFESPHDVRRMLNQLEDEYDYIFLDLPPARSESTYEGLIAADYVLSPCRADRFSANAISNVEEIMREVKSYNNSLKFLGAFITDYDTRYKGQTLLKDEYCKNEALFFQSYIRHSSCFDVALLEGKPIVCYATTTGAEDYRAVAEEMLKRIKKIG